MSIIDMSESFFGMKSLQRDGLIYQLVQSVDGCRVKINGRWVLNFVSSSYLGLNQNFHVKKAAFNALRRWGTFLGTPRLLAIDQFTVFIESEIAHLVGREKALVFPSTTQLALDLLPLITSSRGMLFVDERAYPTSLEGVYAAKRIGARFIRFKHNDFLALERALETHASVRNKIIVCDGVYSSGGHKVPLSKFLKLAGEFNALMYVDDAHGIGVLGEVSTENETPYGYGGGGTPRYFGLSLSRRILHVGTLSKAFGVPVAFIAGDSAIIDRFKYHAKTYTHSSPPSIPVLGAAAASLEVNALRGDVLRYLLYQRVRQFRQGLSSIGVKLTANNYFPIQTVLFPSKTAAAVAAKKMRSLGVWCVLQFAPPDHPKGGVIRFVLTSLHKKEDINETIEIISLCLVPHEIIMI